MIKYFAIGKYYNHLYKHLKYRYSALETYTKGQIKRTVEECKFNKKHLPYAYAIFLSKESLNEVISEEYKNENPILLRSYIAKRFFGGNTEYIFQEHVLTAVGNSGHSSDGGTDGGGH